MTARERYAVGLAVQGDIFAAGEAMREAIEVGEARVAEDKTAEALVVQTRARLVERLKRADARRFTADNVGALLDEAGLARDDQATRRRITSTLIDRGRRAGHWSRVGYAPSARRKCAPIAVWELAEGVE